MYILETLSIFYGIDSMDVVCLCSHENIHAYKYVYMCIRMFVFTCAYIHIVQFILVHCTQQFYCIPILRVISHVFIVHTEMFDVPILNILLTDMYYMYFIVCMKRSGMT